MEYQWFINQETKILLTFGYLNHKTYQFLPRTLNALSRDHQCHHNMSVVVTAGNAASADEYVAPSKLKEEAENTLTSIKSYIWFWLRHLKQVSTSCCFSSRPCYRLLRVRTPTTDTPSMSERVTTCAPGQTAHHTPLLPIKTPQRLPRQTFVLLAQPYIKPEHARHH